MPTVKIELASGKEMKTLVNIRDSVMDAVKTDRDKTECFY